MSINFKEFEEGYFNLVESIYKTLENRVEDPSEISLLIERHLVKFLLLNIKFLGGEME